MLKIYLFKIKGVAGNFATPPQLQLENNNLDNTLRQLNVYTEIYNPQQLNITKCYEMLPILATALSILYKNPKDFVHIDPDTGQQIYSDTLIFLADYLEVVLANPFYNISTKHNA